jgi:predicted DsbA family dithiol-disulfide isomerase
VAGALEPGAGWQMWQGAAWAHPVTTVPAMEAVQAAKAQSLAASEELDAALRVALFGESRCISLRHVILEVAATCPAVDLDALTGALDTGAARRSLMDQAEHAATDAVRGSPHLFLPDGTDVHNPGVELRWNGRKGTGFPVVDRDDPSVYLDLVRRSVASAA